jgi:6-phosphogluconolactonase (cycloisomerase 2 family)
MKNAPILLLVLTLALTGCGSGSRSSKSKSSVAPPSTAPVGSAGTAPPASGSVGPVASGAGPVTGAPPAPALGTPPVVLIAGHPPSSVRFVRLGYELNDAQSDNADLEFEFSTDFGVTWAPATDAGPASGSQGRLGLGSAPSPGLGHMFVWDTLGDLGTVTQVARLRLRATDPDGASAWVETGDFTVSNQSLPATEVYAFVAPSGSNGPSYLNHYALDPVRGTLSPTAASPISLGSNAQLRVPTTLLTDRASRFLFVAYNGSHRVGVLERGAGGQLQPVAGSPFPTGLAPSQMSLHPTGRFLAILEWGSTRRNFVEVHSVDPGNGRMAPVPGSPFDLGNSITDVVFSPSGDFVYSVLDFGVIRVHRVNTTTGELTYASDLSFRATPGQPAAAAFLEIDPQGRTLYCMDIARGIYTFTLDATTGAATRATGPMNPAGSGFLQGSIGLARAGDLFFVSNSVTLYVYRTDPATGGLTQIGTERIGPQTYYMNVDPSDGFLFLSSRQGNDVRVFRIDRQAGRVVEASINVNVNANGSLGPVLGLP